MQLNTQPQLYVWHVFLYMKLFCYLNSTVPYTVDKYSASYKSYLPFLIDYAYILLGISLKV